MVNTNEGNFSSESTRTFYRKKRVMLCMRFIIQSKWNTFEVGRTYISRIYHPPGLNGISRTTCVNYSGNDCPMESFSPFSCFIGRYTTYELQLTGIQTRETRTNVPAAAAAVWNPSHIGL